jgi:hypothetical protein
LLAAPLADVTLHAVVGALVALGAQQLEQAPRRQSLARRPLAVRLQHRVEPRDKCPEPGLRLNLAFVAKLGRQLRTAFRTVCREIRNSRTIWRIGFLSTKNARLIRPIVSTVTIPGRAPQAQPREAFDDPGVGRYSTAAD